jgi:hypothetical protein
MSSLIHFALRNNFGNHKFKKIKPMKRVDKIPARTLSKCNRMIVFLMPFIGMVFVLTLLYPEHLKAQFSESDANIGATFNSSSDLGDYDQDGDLDIIVTGENSGDPGTYISKNVGSGSFEFIFADITNLNEGAAKWADFDGDGDLDLLVTGENFDEVPMTLIYENQGNDEFVDMEANLTNLTNSAADVADVDDDGDIDFLISGEDENGDNHTILYINDGSASFTASDQDFGLFDDGSAVFGDYDNDGDPDLFVNGWQQDIGRNAHIYKNDGSGNFTDIEAGLTGVNRTNRGAAWGDLDGDDDLDLIYVGHQQGEPTTSYYRNEGGDSFNPVDHNIIDLQSGTVSFGDYDDDGDLDLYIAGENDRGEDSGGLYDNDGSGSFDFSSSSIATGEAGSSNWGDLDGDGDLDIVVTGLDNRDVGGNRVLGSVFLNQRFLPGGFTIAETNINGLSEAKIALGDYDNDGDTDIATIGVNNNFIADRATIYENDGLGNFTDIDANLEPATNGTINWVDIDGDDDLDLFLAGKDDLNQLYATIYLNEDSVFTRMDYGVDTGEEPVSAWADVDGDNDPDLAFMARGEEAFTKIYRNEGDTLIDMEYDLQGGFDGSLEFGDYDNDGDADLLMAAAIPDPESVFPDPYSMLYRNDGVDGFSEVNASFEQIPDVGRFADIDGDEDLDVLLSGDNETFLYKNDGNDNFTEVSVDLAGMNDGSADWGDFDDDGDLDLILAGNDDNGDGSTVFYRNDGSGDFNQINSGFASYSEGYARWFDKDGDTDLDLIIMGDVSVDLYENTREEPDTVTDLIDETTDRPVEIKLYQNYPNPFNPTTTLRFSMPAAQKVTLEVFDITGRKVQTVLNDRKLSAGDHSHQFDASNLSSGLYFYRIHTNESAQTRKMTLIK